MYKCTVSGRAVLPDGTRLSYDEYVGDRNHRPHPHWSAIRLTRYNYDGRCCGFCKKKLKLNNFQTHHVSYEHLGHEALGDVITLCDRCHDRFHNTWKHGEYYKEQDYEHWETFSLEDAAKFCAHILRDDYFFGGDLDCCNKDVIQGLIDEYQTGPVPIVIALEDVELYIRNKRYELLFEAEAAGMVLDQKIDAAKDAFLDERFGKKGQKGGNPNRTKARSFILRHDSESFHRNYWYLWHINKLIEEAKKYEQAE